MTVMAILKQKGSERVMTIRPEASMTECVRLLAQHRIGALVVSEDGESLDGIISERDVVRVLAEHGTGCLTRPVSSVMTRDVESCKLDDRAPTLLERMTHGRFRHLPVVENGRLRALISIGDVVKFRISEIEMERTSLEDMIRGT